MSDRPEKSKDARRRLLKSLVAGGGVMATGKLLPDQWAKPVVESVVLPAHGQTTSGELDGVFVYENDVFTMTPSEEPESILDMFATPAQAQPLCANLVSRIQFSVGGGTAMVCVTAFGYTALDATTVDPPSLRLADLFVPDVKLNLTGMKYTPDGNRIAGNTECGPFVAVRTNAAFVCDEGAPILNLLPTLGISSPYEDLG